jgi:hypothetical protein
VECGDKQECPSEGLLVVVQQKKPSKQKAEIQACYCKNILASTMLVMNCEELH